MKATTYAAIDIGSNAVRLLIKRTDPFTDRPDLMLKKLQLVRVPIRLGFDVFTNGVVSEKKAENLLRLMRAFKELMQIYEVDKFRACATAAIRNADNGSEILDKIRQETGISVDILRGEDEARIVYNTHMERTELENGAYLYVDVGGGSTEINFLDNGRLVSSRSFGIGTIKILTGKVKQSDWDVLNEFLEKLAFNYPDITIIGAGGNINKLYKMAEVKDKDERSFSKIELSKLYNTLKPLSIEQRMDRYGLREDRADVIVPGAEIFLNIAEAADARNIIVPKIGVADGIIDGLYLAK